MINNECMKNWYLLFLILFLTSQTAFSAPNYDPNSKPIVYDVSYNIALRKKLEADYDKKYLHVNKDGTYGYYDAPLGAYGREVIVPYDLNKKPDDYKIISK